MGFFLVLKAEVVRSFIIMRRYWFATLTGLIVGYGFLMMLIIAFVASREQFGQIASSVMNESAVRGVLGFIIGMFAFGVVGMFTQGLQGMARTGELEQVCMSPHGLVTNFLARSSVSATMSILSSTIMLTLVAVTLGERLHPDPLPTVILLALTYLNLIGFGFMVGGLVLVFKQVGQVAMLLRLALMFIAVVATEQIETWVFAPARWLAHALPITDAAICLKYVLVSGQQKVLLDEAGEKIIEKIVPVIENEEPLINEAGQPVMQTIYETVHSSVFVHQSFFFLLISCVIWTFVGITCFRFLENWSRSKGTLGAY